MHSQTTLTRQAQAERFLASLARAQKSQLEIIAEYQIAGNGFINDIQKADINSANFSLIS